MKNYILIALLVSSLTTVNIIAQSSVRITEIVMDPKCFDDPCEFVEIKNLSTTNSQDISNWYVSDDETGFNQWIGTFPSGTVMAPGEIMIVAKLLADFNAEYGFPGCFAIEISDGISSSRGLGNSGDFVGLYNSSNSLIHSYSWASNGVDRAEFNGSTWTTTPENLANPCVSSALPISLLHFTATPNNNHTDLLWATATETQNAYFAVERSADGVHFDEITQVPGAGNSAVTKNYAYTDHSPLNGPNYYRLRQVDFDGAYSFSPVRRVVFGEANGVRLQPVPATETLQVLLDKTTEEDINWSVFDQSGRLVLDGQAAEETQQFDVDVQNLPQGIYMLRLTSGQFMHAVRFVKQ